jgi:hypothetical protein
LHLAFCVAPGIYTAQLTGNDAGTLALNAGQAIEDAGEDDEAPLREASGRLFTSVGDPIRVLLIAPCMASSPRAGPAMRPDGFPGA